MKYAKLSQEFLDKIITATLDSKSGDKTMDDFEKEINKIIVEHGNEVKFISFNNFVSCCKQCGKDTGRKEAVFCSLDCNMKYNGIVMVGRSIVYCS